MIACSHTRSTTKFNGTTRYRTFWSAGAAGKGVAASRQGVVKRGRGRLRHYTDEAVNLGGRSRDDVLLAALDRSIAVLTAEYGADPAGWRDQHPRRAIGSLTGVIGPSLTMPYQDRGSWVHVVSFAAPPVTASPRAARPPRRPHAGHDGGRGAAGRARSLPAPARRRARPPSYPRKLTPFPAPIFVPLRPLPRVRTQRGEDRGGAWAVRRS